MHEIRAFRLTGGPFGQHNHVRRRLRIMAKTMIDLQGYPSVFLAGMFLCNAVPHTVAAVQGHPFPTPFAKPRGVGDSSPGINFLWGFANLLAGSLLLASTPVTAGFNSHFLTMLLGVFVIGALTSLHFGKVRRDRAKMI